MATSDDLLRLIAAYLRHLEERNEPGAFAAESALYEFWGWAKEKGLNALGALVFWRQMRSSNRLDEVGQFIKWVAVGLGGDPDSKRHLEAAVSGDLDPVSEVQSALIGTNAGYWERLFTSFNRDMPAPVVGAVLGLKREVMVRFTRGEFPIRMKTMVADRAQRLYVLMMARRFRVQEGDYESLVADPEHVVESISDVLMRGKQR